ncbi:MAG: serine/threonine-protein phosphatase [Nevskia sp.]
MQTDRASRSRVMSAGRTETGYVRRRNEDAILLRDDLGLWLVADGLGGHAAGDRASGLIVERLSALTRDGSLLDFVEAIEDRLAEVNRELRATAVQQGVGLIGSTVVLLVAGPDFMLCGWVGDSRCYCRDDGCLRLMTRDHVVGADPAGDSAAASAAAAGSAALTRAVGADPRLLIDWVVAPSAPGTLFLLCSDGLNKEMSDAEIGREMVVGAPSRTVCDRLIGCALARGARDNVSAVVVTLGA